MKNEKINKKNIFVTGNTIVDVIKNNLNNLKNKKTLKNFNLIKKKYFLITLHRPETVDNLNRITVLDYPIHFVLLPKP